MSTTGQRLYSRDPRTPAGPEYSPPPSPLDLRGPRSLLSPYGPSASPMSSRYSGLEGDEFASIPRQNYKNMPVRPRLFVGSLSEEVDEKEVRQLFSKFGNLIDCYVNPAKNFAFIRMDSREGAQKAQETLDGIVIRGRALRVRRAPHNACLWVGSLAPTVSNELLMEAFSQFGEVERAVVTCDERGRSKGYGFVEFARKTAAQAALKKCNTDYFLITKSCKPVRVEAFEHVENETGLEAKTLARYPGIEIQLSVPPRFAKQGDLEYQYSVRWRKLYEEEKRLKNELRQKIAEKRNQLEKEQNAMMAKEEKRLRELERREQERQLQELRVRQQQLALALGGQNEYGLDSLDPKSWSGERPRSSSFGGSSRSSSLSGDVGFGGRSLGTFDPRHSHGSGSLGGGLTTGGSHGTGFAPGGSHSGGLGPGHGSGGHGLSGLSEGGREGHGRHGVSGLRSSGSEPIGALRESDLLRRIPGGSRGGKTTSSLSSYDRTLLSAPTSTSLDTVKMSSPSTLSGFDDGTSLHSWGIEGSRWAGGDTMQQEGTSRPITPEGYVSSLIDSYPMLRSSSTSRSHRSERQPSQPGATSQSLYDQSVYSSSERPTQPYR